MRRSTMTSHHFLCRASEYRFKTCHTIVLAFDISFKFYLDGSNLHWEVPDDDGLVRCVCRVECKK